MHIHQLKWTDISGVKTLVGQIRESLSCGSGVCVIKNVPIDDNNAAYLSIVNNLGGELLRDMRMPARSLEADSVIYRVEEDPLNTDVFAHSATSDHFPLHTDCAHFLHPPQVMMLLCCRPSKTNSAGETLLASVDDVIGILSDQQVETLATHPFDWWRGPNNPVQKPILTRTNSGRSLIRFNQATLRREMSDDDFTNSSVLQTLINALNGFETDPRNAISLTTGDLLVVHNQRILHGRTAFRSGSPRLLKRIRIRVPDL